MPIKHKVLQGSYHGVKEYYDLSTSNKSFLETSEQIRKIGIRHNKFILKVKDINVIGLDPWSDNLTLQEKASILNECINNFWYFVREVVKVIVPGGKIPYVIHRGNLAESFAMMKNINQILVLPRQHYKTQSAVVFYLWQILFKAKNYQYIFAHKSYEDASSNLKRLVDAMDGIPPFLLAGVDKGKDNFNKESMTIKSSNNHVRIMGASTSKDGADKQGRGATVPSVWVDEFAFYKYNKTMFGSLVPANSTASRIAKENHTPFGMLLTTTPKIVGHYISNNIGILL